MAVPTVTDKGAVTVEESPPSVAVAATVSTKLSVDPAGGVTVRAARFQAETSATVLPAVAVKLLVPSVIWAPTGIADIATARLSEPSVSVRAADRVSAMAVSGGPLAADAVRLGASATAATATASGWGAVDVLPPLPVAVATTVSEKSVSLSAGGVIVSPVRSPGANVQEPSPLSVPADSAAPAGTPETVTDSVSVPPGSARLAVMSSTIAVSSFPVASVTVRFGGAPVPVTVTLNVLPMLLVSAPSVASAVTVRSKLFADPGGGVMVSAAKVQPVMSAVVLPALAVTLLVPSVRTAPMGMSDTVSVRLSEPSVSVRAAPTLSAMAVSWSPVAGSTVRLGVSATGDTEKCAVLVSLVPSGWNKV